MPSSLLFIAFFSCLSCLSWWLFFHQCANRLGDGVRVGYDGGLQGRAVGRRRVDSMQPTDGGVKIVKAAVDHASSDLGADAKRTEGAIDDQQPARLAHRRENGL